MINAERVRWSSKYRIKRLNDVIRHVVELKADLGDNPPASLKKVIESVFELFCAEALSIYPVVQDDMEKQQRKERMENNTGKWIFRAEIYAILYIRENGANFTLDKLYESVSENVKRRKKTVENVLRKRIGTKRDFIRFAKEP